MFLVAIKHETQTLFKLYTTKISQSSIIKALINLSLKNKKSKYSKSTEEDGSASGDVVASVLAPAPPPQCLYESSRVHTYAWALSCSDLAVYTFPWFP